ncbi:serine hydrolase, partial [bacterium]|nr:serine hydrolase [bacterium]
DVGLNHVYINAAYQALREAVAEGAAPGAVGLVLKDGKIAARRAIGHRQTQIVFRSSETDTIKAVRFRTKMLEQTIFDLASLTKMIATTTSIMILVEEGKIQLDDPVVKYLPAFAEKGKKKVTVRHLLTHTSGLPSWHRFYEECVNRSEVFTSIDTDFELLSPPGTKRVYSDLGFMVLGRLVEVVSGERLDRFAKKHIFDPLGMKHTGFLPPLKDRLLTAPTEYDAARNKILKGIVHDGNARAMGGISGHAGLFSDSDGLAIFAQMLLNKGEFQGTRILKEETVATMLKPQLNRRAVRNGSGFLRERRQLLGWWGMDEKVTIGDIGGLPSKTAYGHSGFTGTMLYIDPEHNCAAILLTNAVHPERAKADKTRLYRAFFINISKAIAGPKGLNIEPE